MKKAINGTIPRQRRLTLPQLGCLLVLAGAILLTGIACRYASANLLDGDASGEMVLGHLLYENGGILSDTWAYSTELRVVNSQLFYKLFFYLFSDWQTVRFAATMTMLACMLAAWGYLARQMRVGITGFALAGAVLLLPFSVTWGRIVLYQSYYTMYVALEFLYAGLCLSLLREKRRGAWLLKAAVLFLLSVAGGLDGVRLVMNSAAPLLCVFLVYALRPSLPQKNGEKPGVRTLVRALPAPILSAAGLLLGCLINAGPLSAKYSFTHLTYTTADPPKNYLWSLLTAFLRDFGYETGQNLFSLHGILAVLSALLVLGLAVLALWQLTHAQELPDHGFAATALCASLLVIGLTMALLRNENGGYVIVRYLLPTAAWCIPVLGTAVAHAGHVTDGRAAALRLTAAGLSLVLLVNGCLGCVFFVSPERYPLTYDDEGIVDTGLTARLRAPVAWLLENGYEVGVASHYQWDANTMIELSDGRLTVTGLVCTQQQLGFYRWLTDTSLYAAEAADDDRPAFALVRCGEEDEAFTSRAVGQAGTCVYDDGYFRIYHYDRASGLFSALAPIG